jgi:hypothetical protein
MLARASKLVAFASMAASLSWTMASAADCTPASEVCDGIDNDCDGITDEQDPNTPPLCAPGYTCVNVNTHTACDQPCAFAGFPCPPGYACGSGISNETGMPVGNFCTEYLCGDCAKKTVFNADGSILCAPKDTPPDANCAVPPVCFCKNYLSCRAPCDGVVCTGGKVCTEYGNLAGTCVDDVCPDVPCQGCNKVCFNGTCVTNPCSPDVCPGQVCTPSDDYSTYACVDPCANGGCGGHSGAAGAGGSAGGVGGGLGGMTTGGAGGATTQPGDCACEMGSAASTGGSYWLIVGLALRRMHRRFKHIGPKRSQNVL